MTDISNQNDQLPRVVTRMEIIDALGTAFGRNGATKQDILAAATQEECREEILATLRRAACLSCVDLLVPPYCWSCTPHCPLPRTLAAVRGSRRWC